MNNFSIVYKPKHCSGCGEEVKRAQWNWLTSRKFCEDCDNTVLGTHDRVRNAVGAASVFLFGVFAATLTLNFLQPKQTAIVHTKQAAPIASPAANAADSKLQTAPQSNVAAAQTQPQNQAAQTPQTPRALAANPNAVAPVVESQQTADNAYYCGARTQKGTLCSRRVRGGGRCWQHTGKPPLVAQEKLLIR